MNLKLTTLTPNHIETADAHGDTIHLMKDTSAATTTPNGTDRFSQGEDAGTLTANKWINKCEMHKTPILPKYHHTQAYIDGFKDGWVYQNKESTQVDGDYGFLKNCPASSAVN
jgi:hypothetical protein